MENPVKTPSPKPAVARETPWVEWFTDDFYPRYSRQIWIVVAAVAAVAALYFAWNMQSERNGLRTNKELGSAYVLLSQEKYPEAEKALIEFLGRGPSGLARDKANLYLGKLYYNEQKYDPAAEAYGRIHKGGKSTLLLYSGALHGRAACAMQKQDYATAAALLQEFLAVTMRRTGNPKENLAGEEVVDESPSVPNALWKQALCYRALKQPDKVKAAVDQLRKAYPASREAQDGAKLLALME